jgi:hypothetical protein
MVYDWINIGKTLKFYARKWQSKPVNAKMLKLQKENSQLKPRRNS